MDNHFGLLVFCSMISPFEVFVCVHVCGGSVCVCGGGVGLDI